MYVYQNGKLYIEVEEKLVGVEIYSDKTLLVEDCDSTFIDGQILTPFEVQCMFNIKETPYIFPREIVDQPKGEVVQDEPIKPIKRTARKSTSK